MNRLKQTMLLAGDLLVLYLSLFLSVSLRNFEIGKNSFSHLFPVLTPLYFFAVVVFFIIGLYDIGRLKNTWQFYQKIIYSAVIWFFVGIAYFYLVPSISVTPKTILVLNTFFGFGFIALWRAFCNRFLSHSIWKNNIVFVGLNAESAELINILEEEKSLGYEVLGLVEKPENVPNSIHLPVVEDLKSLAQNCKKSIHLIVISPAFAGEPTFVKDLYGYLFQQVQMVELAQFYEEILGRIPPATFSEAWFLTNLHEQQKKMYDRFRILIDFSVAIFLGIIFLVTFPFIALAIKLTSKGPIFFIQTRVGRVNKNFRLYKYRTMKVLNSDGSAETTGPQFASQNDPRITTVGTFLRRTRLDELPQFINILKNEMGLIGPRPERPEFAAQLTSKMPFYALRHLIKPGLTGLAQLHKAYYGTIDENLRKLEYDLYYVKNRGFFTDISIMLRTINIVMRMRGR
jgi:exopolysaccharide biosynthesis polyprenyl glycosylphosphotransferase